MLVAESRPRTLRWVHAGPLLYGDWGTSRLYVLGLAFLYTAHASVVYLAAIGLLMIAVSWAYTVVCRSFPDGGGVYTAGRQIHPALGVVGATLLLSGYIMTAAISLIEAFHYFGVGDGWILPLGIGAAVLIGGINWLGARSAARFAFVIAFGALLVSAVVAVLCIPFFKIGLQTFSLDFFKTAPPSEIWISFTRICLALAGIEAVANMTGLMKKPVDKEAKKTIWPVTIEVVVLNMVFGIALAGLAYTVNNVALADQHVPHVHVLEQLHAQAAAGEIAIEQVVAVEAEVAEYTNAAMKVIAEQSGEHFFGEAGGKILGTAAGITFGLLLLSATNTAIMATVSVLFAMARDRELPRQLTKLNYSGVPWVGLVVAVVIPIGVITIEQDVTTLAKLYVLGVCGAISTTMLSCALNKKLKASTLERAGLWTLAALLLAITVTIGVTEWVSTAFCGGLVALVLSFRALSSRRATAPDPLPEPVQGWLATVKESAVAIDPSKPKIMLAARGRYQAEFAVDMARRRNATLFAVFVRTLRVMDIGPIGVPRIEDDHDAQIALGTTAVLAKAAGVDYFPIYVVSSEIAEQLVDYTVTYGCDTLIMGKTRRSLFARKIEGDVISSVASLLPDGVSLVTRSASTPHIPSAHATDE